MGKTPCTHAICEGCPAACCRNQIVFVMQNDSVPDELTQPHGWMSKVRVMRHNPDGSCIALVDDRCSIYDRRPDVCRRFAPGGRACERMRMK